jgi:hypothetical protein
MFFANILEMKMPMKKARIPERTIAIKIIIKSFEVTVFRMSFIDAAVPVLDFPIEYMVT